MKDHEWRLQHENSIYYLGKMIHFIRCTLNTWPGWPSHWRLFGVFCDEAYGKHGIDGGSRSQMGLRCLVQCGCPWRVWAASRFQLWVSCSPRAGISEAAAGPLMLTTRAFCLDKVLFSQLALAGLIKREGSG